jgi:hypothetical protein
MGEQMVIKVSKNVTFKLENLMIVEQMMVRTRRNFSQTVNIILENWIRVTKMLDDQKKESEKINADRLKEITRAERYKEQILKAKPIKEEK